MNRTFLLRAVLVIQVSLICFTASGQKIEWEKSYGGNHSDYLFDVIATSDYGFLVAGSSLSKKTGNKTEGNSGNLDYFLWKMNHNGELDWQKSFGGSGADFLRGVCHTRDGGFILAGNSDSPADFQKKDSCRGSEDYWIIKLNAKGDEEWQRTIGGSGQEVLQSIWHTTDGGYILGGSSSSSRGAKLIGDKEDVFGKSQDSQGSMDYWVVKLDAKGGMEWQRTIGGLYADHLRAVQQTSDGGYILGGSSNSPESGEKSERCYGESDYWVVKLEKSGNIEWQSVYGGDQEDELYSLIQTADGNFILGGNSASGANGNKVVSNLNGIDFWVLKIDTTGKIVWQKSYDIGKVDFFASIVEDKDGSLLLGGHAQSETTGTKKKDREGINDYVAIKVDSKGDEIWRESVGSDGDEVLRKALLLRDGGYLLSGTSKGKSSRNRNTGIGRNDFWIVKLKDNKKVKHEKLPIEAFPNPTQRLTNVVVGYEFTNGTATVYDIAGRLLQQFAVYSNTIPVDLGSYPVGMYIIQIKTAQQTNSVKVIKTTAIN